MHSSRFLFIPTVGSPGGGDVGFFPSVTSVVRLTVHHPIFNGLEYLSFHTHTWTLSFTSNQTEGGTGVDYTEWRRQVTAGVFVTARFYDDSRGWWWEVDGDLVDVHPNPLGTDVQEGFQGSEDDGLCNPFLNDPIQQSSSVVNMVTAPDKLLLCGGTDPHDPDFCSCSQGKNLTCAHVATVELLTPGEVTHVPSLTSNGARKYAYDCVFIP